MPQEAAPQLFNTLGFDVYGHEKRALKVDAVYLDKEHQVLWLFINRHEFGRLL